MSTASLQEISAGGAHLATQTFPANFKVVFRPILRQVLTKYPAANSTVLKFNITINGDAPGNFVGIFGAFGAC